jgi:UDPglucose 6-dehydrogenase
MVKITIIGTGYVGLVTGACLAEAGNDVLCLDLNLEKIRILQSGGIPIYEPGLQEMVQRNVAAGRLHFTNDIAQSVAHGLFQFIAVGTPPDEDGSADLQYVLGAAKNIADHMSDYKIIVTKSTVPVGTGMKVKSVVENVFRNKKESIEYSVVSNPEFLKEGSAIDDFMTPDRIVIGAEDDRAINWMQKLYAPFYNDPKFFIAMNIESAELTKYAANAMLAVRISFMNELANLAEGVGADIEMVRHGIGTDKRIGAQFLYPGCGYGGSCFPKDVKALIKTAKNDANMALRLLSSAEAVNESQKHVLAEKVKKSFGSDLHGKHFAMWGLAFKPNTDDMREAASREIIADLLEAGATISAFDPVAMHEAQRVFSDARLTFAANAMDALTNADALLIVTEWDEFRVVDLDLVKSALKTPIIFDGRNLFDPKTVATNGITYHSIGRAVL